MSISILAVQGDSHWMFFDGNYQEYEADKKKRLGEEGAKPCGFGISRLVGDCLPRIAF